MLFLKKLLNSENENEMKKIFSFYLLVFWCGTCLFAQNNSELLEDAKFKLIKNAVRFYSKDKKAGWSTPSDCADKTDISSLKECAKGMTGVSEKISDWEKDGITNIETLNKFKKKIENIKVNEEVRISESFFFFALKDALYALSKKIVEQ